MFCGSSGGGCFSICGFDSEAELAEMAGELCACKLDAQKRLMAVNNGSLIIGFCSKIERLPQKARDGAPDPSQL
jgi:hypothetical protein